MHVTTFGDTHTKSDTSHSVGLLWTRDRSFAKTSTLQHITLTRNRFSCPSVGFEPTIPPSERSQTQGDRAATGIECTVPVSSYFSAAWGLVSFDKDSHCIKNRVQQRLIYRYRIKQFNPSNDRPAVLKEKDTEVG
jgi:hypothetical protein